MRMVFDNNTGMQRLGSSNEAHLYALSQQGNESLNYATLMEQATAQSAMQQIASEQNLEVPKVNFYPSRHPDPHKARRKDIRQARKLLSPAKRAWFNPMRWLFGQKYRYDRQASMCVVDGCDCAKLIQHDNLYAKITDEETGYSLWQLYWQNPVTKEAEAFVAKEKVMNGRKMKGTYCPEHLHLYHLLNRWEAEEDKLREANPRRLRDRVKKGVSMVTVPVATIKKKDPTPEFLQKYEEFFAMLEKDSKSTKGISILNYENPVTGMNDVTMIVFDLRIFQQELAMMNQPTPAFQTILNQQVQQNTLEEVQLGGE